MHTQGMDQNTQPTRTVKSGVVYLEVMNAIADSKDTVMEILNNY